MKIAGPKETNIYAFVNLFVSCSKIKIHVGLKFGESIAVIVIFHNLLSAAISISLLQMREGITVAGILRIYCRPPFSISLTQISENIFVNFTIKKLRNGPLPLTRSFCFSTIKLLPLFTVYILPLSSSVIK